MYMASFFLEAIKKNQSKHTAGVSYFWNLTKDQQKVNQSYWLQQTLDVEAWAPVVSESWSKTDQISSRVHLLFCPSPELCWFSTFVNCFSSISHRQFTRGKRMRGARSGTVWGLSSRGGGEVHTPNMPVNALIWERGGKICPLSNGQGLLQDVT